MTFLTRAQTLLSIASYTTMRMARDHVRMWMACYVTILAPCLKSIGNLNIPKPTAPPVRVNRHHTRSLRKPNDIDTDGGYSLSHYWI